MSVWNKQPLIFCVEKTYDKNFAGSLASAFFQKLLLVSFHICTFEFMFVLAGEEQRHFVHNAFNVLVNEGFLHDQQGVHTLEVVQKFHEIIKEKSEKARKPKKNKTKEKPRKATVVVANLETYCPGGVFTFDNQAVITLVYEDSNTKEKYYHAVRVSEKDVNLCFMFQFWL